ncbi:Imm21 family immunity protein [Actinomadura rifamycini]|nr:Imm21 family immunity protein [Actinomadura rifamycini]
MRFTWVESGGGPLVVVPEALLVRWAGAEGDGPEETWGDYGRACAVDGYIGLVPVGAGHALVLGDEPATTTYLPDERAFLRWSAADSEAALVAAAETALRSSVRWDEELTWDAGGPAVLFDSAYPGPEPGPGDRLRVELPPGPHRVRAAYREDASAWMHLVRLDPAA